MLTVDPQQTIAETFRRRAGSPFLIDAPSGRELTYAEVERLARGVAGVLRERGLKPGDRLGVALPNGLELALVYLGALLAGIVVVPLGSGFGRRELRSILRRTGTALVLIGGISGTRVAPVASELGLTVAEVASPSEDGGLDLLGVADPGTFSAIEGDQLASIHFTSGTTGPPRGIAHHLSDFVGNAHRFSEAVGLTSDTRFYATLPMTYMAGYYNLLLLPLAIGASVVLDRSFDARLLMSYWDAPARHQVNSLWLVPTVAALLLEVDRGDAGPAFCREQVSFAAIGTAPLDPDLRLRFEERYGIPLHDSYGLSETLLATTSTPDRPAPSGSVGSTLPDVEVRFAGELGTVQIASPDMFAGYLPEDGGAPDQPFEAPLVDGRWLDTGDIGELTADGALRITGRAKEVIIRGGINVSPREVERALESHAAVERVAVVGLPHQILGEEVAAVVTCVAGHSLDTVEPELKALANSALEEAQRPDAYVQIDDMPVTPTGKVRRATLRDMVIDHLGLPSTSKGFQVEGSADRLVDLTHELREGMTSFPSPNHPPFESTQLARLDVEGRVTRRLTLGTHTGTHMDAPLHFLPGGPGVETFGLEDLVGPATVIDLTPVASSEEISSERLREALGARRVLPRLLLRFDWSQRFDDVEQFYRDSPYLTEEACEWIVAQGVRLLGMDTPSPDDPANGYGSERDSPNHQTLLGAGMVLLEYLNGLDQLDEPEVFLMALPLRIPGADGAPARVVAMLGSA